MKFGSKLLFVAGLLLAAFAPIPAGAADAQHTLAVQLDWLPTSYHGPLLLAAEKGWYRDAGIDVSFVPGKGSAMTVQLVAGGQYDIGLAALSTMAFARGKGLPVVAVAGFFRKGDLALIVPVGSPLTSPADLAGKTLLYTEGSLEAPFVAPFLAKGKLDPQAVTLRNVSTSAKNATYSAGEADGVFSTALFAPLVADRRPSRPILFADFGLNLPGFGLFALQSTLDKKGDAVRAFASVAAGAWAYVAKGHEDEAVQALLHAFPNERTDEGQMRRQLAASFPFLHGGATEKLSVGIETEEDWAETIALMEEVKAIAPGSKPNDYFTNRYLDVALVDAIGGR